MLKIKSQDIIALFIYCIFNAFFSLIIIYIIKILLSNNIKHPDIKHIACFLTVLIYSYLLNIFFQKKILERVYKAVYDYEFSIFKTLFQSSLNVFENNGGNNRIFGILNDVRLFLDFPSVITSCLNSISLIIICMIYLFIESTLVASILLLIIILLTFIYYRVVILLNKGLKNLATINDRFNFYIIDSINGFKQLKISFFKRKNLLNKYIKVNRKEAKDIDIMSNNVYTLINLFSQYGQYFLLVIVLSLSISGILEAKSIVVFVIVILFLRNPINTLMANQKYFGKLIVSKNRIESFFTDFNEENKNEIKSLTIEDKNEKICFQNLTFKYPNKLFEIKIKKLEIKFGETIFIIGGNGSGKSTFLNLLLNLYYPQKGKIFIDKRIVRKDDYNYMKLFSPVFSDNHLFYEHYDDDIETSEEYNCLLKKMKLDSIIHENENVTKRTFSKGQGKRLSMIYALLEKRPILVLDEWAADQDPHFRKYFYEEFIPELKKQGKTIIAVTHDDAYFKYADRILKFEYGKIIKDVYTKDRNALNELKVW